MIKLAETSYSGPENLPTLHVQGPELKCLHEVKEDLSLVLIFQHAINAK